MNNNALDILNRLLTSNGKEKRLTELIKDPQKEYTDEWYMSLPTSFNEALDIKRTPRKTNGIEELVWTQSSRFSFDTGDTIYDTSYAYMNEWLEALKYIKLCVQVNEAINATPADKTHKRMSGMVNFDIFIPNKQKSKLTNIGKHTLTQDDFVRFLISGPKEDFKEAFS
ncbi:hypothetical protein KAI19_06365 [bacterium]|nr:hypothetical protein [bacterium]